MSSVISTSSSRVFDAINECLFLLQSDSVEAQEKALQMLASITKVSSQNRTSLAQTEGAIPTIATLTNSSSTIIQTLSLLTLFNLSLNPDLKQSLADMETIYYLNSLITNSSFSLDSSKLASSLICSLAMHDKNKAKFGVAGTVQLLVKAVEGSHGSDAHHLLSSLAELVHFHGNCTLAVRAGAVAVLLKVVKGTDNEDLAGTSLAVLSLLARFDEGLNGLKKRDDIIRVMLNVLKGRSLLSKEGAADILIRLFDDSEDCVTEALMLPEFSTVLADLCVRGSVRVRDKADLLMKKMAQMSLDSDMDVSSLHG
ncbi:U-box domain-containing protein 14-like [Vigna unguiculata]|uniref:Armadillo-type fold n=1 Tax=Vigna unguiculata TaxID=3917 RepID=A0A4D6NQP3_VIGUN|nr:U-box domain-containing protein 14-like [Vigna unguiculata]QCE16220.1 Armadillo-type fold [Vigna unguiculata]